MPKLSCRDLLIPVFDLLLADVALGDEHTSEWLRAGIKGLSVQDHRASLFRRRP